MSRGGGTAQIREELIAVRSTRRCDRAAEAAGLLRSAGTLQLHAGGALGFEAVHAHPGVARRIHEAMAERLGHPDRTVILQAGQGHPQTRYVVHLERVPPLRLIDAGLLDEAGHPTHAIPEALVKRSCCVGAYLRGAFLGRGSAHPAKSGPHLEIRIDDLEAAHALARLVARLGAKAAVREHRGVAVVAKDERSVVTLLAAIGAHEAALAREEASIWKGLHADANRLRNADAANASKQGRAAAAHLAAIAELEDRVGLQTLAPALQEAARHRRAEPEATLAELAAAAGISKGAMADRLRRLARLAARGS